MKAIKLHPVTHQYPIDGSAFRTVFDFAAQRGLPILSHEWGTPEFLDRLSAEHPGVSFIVAHMGFWDGRKDFAYEHVVTRRENVYVDLAYSNVFYNALERLVGIVGLIKSSSAQTSRCMIQLIILDELLLLGCRTKRKS